MPVFVTATDVIQQHAAVKSELDALDAAILQCVAEGKLKADDPRSEAYQAFRTRALTYLADEPSNVNTSAQMLEGQSILRDAKGYRDQLVALGCVIGPAPEAVSKPANVDEGPKLPDVAPPLEGASKVLMWLVIGYVVVKALR